MEFLRNLQPKEINTTTPDDLARKKLPEIDVLNSLIGLPLDGKPNGKISIEDLNATIEYCDKRLPSSGGEWTGEPGNSEWVPDNDVIPKQPPGNELAWEEIKEKYGIESIPFNDGEPDFSAVSEATVEIDDFTTDRNMNFTQADEACAKKWTEEDKDGRSWTAADVKEYRKENQLSWHERSDQKTMDLVPQEVHGNVPHSGGISAAKRSE